VDIPRAAHLDERVGEHLEWHICTLWTPFTWGGVHGGRTTRQWKERFNINHDRHHGKFNIKYGHIPHEWITRYQTSTVRKEEASRYTPGAPTSKVTIWQTPPTLSAITVESILAPWFSPRLLEELGVGLPATGARAAHHSVFTASPNTLAPGDLPPGWRMEPEDEPTEWWWQEALEWGPSPHGFPPGNPWVNYIDPSASPERRQRPSTHLLARARNALIRHENSITTRERHLIKLWWTLSRRMCLERQALRSTLWWSDSEYSDSHPSPRDPSGMITPSSWDSWNERETHPSGAMNYDPGHHPDEEGVVHRPGPLPLVEEDPTGASSSWE
jgi:hypothetical protein